MASALRQVAIFIAAPSGSGQVLLEGIACFHPSTGPWSVRVVQDRVDWLVKELKRWRGDGVLCTARTPEIAAAAEALRCPVVNLAGRLGDLPLPSVLAEERAVGEAAGQYLLARGFQKFAYVGRNDAFSTRRSEGFERVIVREGHPPPTRFVRHEQDEELLAWLTDVAYPAAVFTQDDYASHHVLRLCQRRGVQVPEQVALLGVDDLWWLCELAYPPLSSIDTDINRRGREAAALLERLMDGHAKPSAPIFIPPVGVVTRRSTDIFAVQDRDLVAALRFIRERYSEAITPDDVADHVLVSRRTLTRRFASHFNRSLREELWRVRIEAAQKLLTGTDLSMLDVALRCGFSGASVFSSMFKKRTGTTPSGFRRRRGLSAPA